jgi:hypothetical protein
VIVTCLLVGRVNRFLDQRKMQDANGYNSGGTAIALESCPTESRMISRCRMFSLSVKETRQVRGVGSGYCSVGPGKKGENKALPLLLRSHKRQIRITLLSEIRNFGNTVQAH